MSQVRQCASCVMDDCNDPDITFDKDGICSYCHKWKSLQKPHDLEKTIAQVKELGKGKPYDCISGISGGVDSTYTNYLLKSWGLRPLLVHFDNGWNSELAVQNIENAAKRLGFDLYTHVVDWEEFKDIQLSYFKASVVDIEFPTDHAIVALLYQQALKYGISNIITGGNLATEGILPHAWRWSKMDVLNMESIHRAFGTKKIRTLPTLGFWKNIYVQKFCHIQNLQILNMVPFDKEHAKQVIQKELAWKDYGGKHSESVFTRFYQNYLLPKKFGIDKRKAHFSSMICANLMTKSQALVELNKPLYDHNLFQSDYEFVLKKWGLSPHEFERLMSVSPVSHLMYDSYLKKHYLRHETLFKTIRPFTRILKHMIQSKRELHT